MFGKPKSLIGMVHVRALPGAPFHSLSVSQILDKAAEEAGKLAAWGFDAIIVENMHDRPYVHAAQGPEVTALMTLAARAAREAAPALPLGIQVLSGGNEAAIAIASAISRADSPPTFIRCENFVFSHVADEGLLERAEAGTLLRYRRAIGAEHVQVFCDVKKKHASHAMTADVGLDQAVAAAEFFGADGVIVTGESTGLPTAPEDLELARASTRLPVLVGSGVTPDTVVPLLAHADALIVGSALKQDGHWAAELDESRCRAIVAARDA